MTETTLRFTALDTLFCRESRPFDTIGGSELGSVFPPPPRTIAGAIRTAIGESAGVNWFAFLKAAEEGRSYEIGGVVLSKLIGGKGDDMGQIALQGLWLVHGDTRLYPAPLFLLRKEPDLTRLRIGTGVQTHLGHVRLPELSAERAGYQPLEGVWLTCTGLERVLAGGLPKADDLFEKDLFEKKDLFIEEPRLGIARNNTRRTVETGLLYQSRHVRPVRDLAIEVDVTGLDQGILNKMIVRLGGEGRMAGFKVATRPARLPAKPALLGNTKGLILTLLTPGRFASGREPSCHEPSWLPGFEPTQDKGHRVWKGTIEGIALTIHCAVIGKTQREGGWDMALHQPRAVQSLIPAGSSYYCTVDNNDIATAIDKLHGRAVGEDQTLGRGRFACGLWNDNE